MEMHKRKKSKMSCLFGGSGESRKRRTVQSRSPSNANTEENLSTIEVAHTNSKQDSGMPMKTSVAEEMSNETSAEEQSPRPTVYAKLMGLDGLASSQLIHTQQRKLPDNSLGGRSHEKPFSNLFSNLSDKSKMKQPQYKDVQEDRKTSHVAKRYPSQSSVKGRVTKRESACIQERCVKVVQNSNKRKSKLERADPNSGMMLNLRQQPGSVFVKNMHDQQGAPSSSRCNHIAVLRPSNSVRPGSHGKRRKEVKETFESCDPVYQRYKVGPSSYSSHSTSNPHRRSRVKLERKEVTAPTPNRIVVLKPNIEKTDKNTNGFRSPDDCTKNTECSNSVGGDGGSRMYKGSLGEVKSPRCKPIEAREAASEITNQMKECSESEHVNLPDCGLTGGEEPILSPFTKPDSYVIREAKKRMSERWNMTHAYKDLGAAVKGSTLGEMLSLAASETRPVKLDGVESHNGVNDDGDFRSTARSRSLPPSLRNHNHSMSAHHDACADEKLVVHSEPLNRGRNQGMKENLSHREFSLFKALRYNRRFRSSRCTADQPQISNIFSASPSAASVVDSVVSDMVNISSESSTKLSPELATCMIEDKDSFCTVEESSNSQEPSAAKSGDTVSMQLSGPEPEISESSKEVDHCGQISLKAPAEDVSSGSDCFESLTAQLHELKKQLQLLKMESGSTSKDLTLNPIDEDIEAGSSTTISDPNNWESTYLTDILQASGFYDNDPYIFMTWYTIDSPIDTFSFDHLEEKYFEDITVSRSERRLFYDRVNDAFSEISKSTISRLLTSQRGVRMAVTEAGFEDQLREVLVTQEEEAAEVRPDLEWFEEVIGIDTIGKEIEDLLLKDLIDEVLTI